MTRHLLVLTIDVDPDGLNREFKNRQALTWDSLPRLPWFTGDVPPVLERIPVTWFVRADGQLRDSFGDSLHLFSTYEDFWSRSSDRGDEIAWHPHLYKNTEKGGLPALIEDPSEAIEEIERLWEDLRALNREFTAFRSGEAWMTAPMLNRLEKLGLEVESSVLPGRKGGADNPMNWLEAPNHPYYPDRDDMIKPGDGRDILEIPINTWLTKASYDEQPRVRYMNPAVREDVFRDAVSRWEKRTLADSGEQDGLKIWVLILHPEEMVSAETPDLLYANDQGAFCRNLTFLGDTIEAAGCALEYTTLTRAARSWKEMHTP